MRMATFMTDAGRMIKRTVSEFTHIWMELGTKATGKRTSSTVMALRLGLMVHRTKVLTLRERSTGMAASLGPTDPPTMVNLLITTLRVRESTTGAIRECIEVTGRTTKWKAMESSNGPMVASTKVNT
jgi:hypothetical protein